jgi:AraC-like DNA-binding protein
VLKVMRDRPSDLVESRRRARVAFVAAIWLYACVGIVLQLIYDDRLPAPLVRANVVLLLIVALAGSTWVALGSIAPLRGVRRPGLSEAEPLASHLLAAPARAARTPAVDTGLVARIRAAMETDRLYRQEELTVAGLARALGSQEYLVRRAINQGLGYRNFNEFLHRYRLDEASARLRTQTHLPILTIALDVGFGSIGPFNRAFRARFGCTPTHYRGGGAEPVAQAAGADASPRAAD